MISIVVESIRTTKIYSQVYYIKTLKSKRDGYYRELLPWRSLSVYFD